MVIHSGFSHEKLWFSIAMLVYQRVHLDMDTMIMDVYEYLWLLDYNTMSWYLNLSSWICYGCLIDHMWKRKWYEICCDGSYMARFCNICMLIIAVYLFIYILIYCIVQHWMTFFCHRESITSPFIEGFPRSKLRKGISRWSAWGSTIRH